MKNTTTTLNAIQEHALNTTSWNKLLTSLRKTKADDDPISLKYILETLGIKDAIWCLRCFDYKDYCLFNADVAESVLPIFENAITDDKRPRLCIQAIRDFHAGKITDRQLAAAAGSAYAAAFKAQKTAIGLTLLINKPKTAETYAASAAYAAERAATVSFGDNNNGAYEPALYADNTARDVLLKKVEKLFIHYFS